MNKVVCRLLLLAVVALGLMPFSANAQQAQRLPAGVACGSGAPPAGMSPPYMDANGLLCTSSVGGGGTANNVTLVPTAGTPTQAAVSCLATTTTLLAAAAATSFWLVQNPSTATTTVWINTAGAAAVAAPPSISLTAGQSMYFPAAGYLPNALISCITTTGTQSVSITSK